MIVMMIIMMMIMMMIRMMGMIGMIGMMGGLLKTIFLQAYQNPLPSDFVAQCNSETVSTGVLVSGRSKKKF